VFGDRLFQNPDDPTEAEPADALVLLMLLEDAGSDAVTSLTAGEVMRDARTADMVAGWIAVIAVGGII
jgi:hypothetical protein